jgi:metal-responsive CopG/Arc/MetJ family transcriptional regulator
MESAHKKLDKSYTKGYTYTMKTAISINDDIYREAEMTAQELGLSRSKLYSLAIKEFIQTHKPEAVTSKLNAVYDKIDSKLEDDIAQTNYDLLSNEEW